MATELPPGPPPVLSGGPAPRVPRTLHPLAREILEALRKQPGASGIVLGGGVALRHYLELDGP